MTITTITTITIGALADEMRAEYARRAGITDMARTVVGASHARDGSPVGLDDVEMRAATPAGTLVVRADGTAYLLDGGWAALTPDMAAATTAVERNHNGAVVTSRRGSTEWWHTA